MITSAPSAPAVPSEVVLSDTGRDAGTRGSTTLSDRVIEKIAARAALEISDCVGLERRIAGIGTRHPGVNATATTDGSITGLSLTLGILYPAPITTTTRAVRTHVQERVGTLCDLTVDHIDIKVAALIRPDRKEKRVR